MIETGPFPPMAVRRQASLRIAPLALHERWALALIGDGYSFDRAISLLGLTGSVAAGLEQALMTKVGAATTADLVRIALTAHVEEQH